MLNKSYLKKVFFIPIVLISCICYAQPIWTTNPFGNEKKPEKYEEKLLASEKTATKKFGVGRRFLQNTISHYNFFYNANNGINTVIEKAKLANQDDFSKLLPFYAYKLENTASQKTELDSVIYRCTSGILLHDLRTEWVDNFYLLIGKAYFLKKDFDSAALTFQFINYNLFPRKRKNDDDTKVVGSNDAETGVGSVSIANKEKKGFYNNKIKRPPSRNEALILLTRTFIEQNELGDAAGLISILQNDPNLPKRLQNDLEETTAYWFYKQSMYDSSAVHLEKALSNADTKEDKSRWQFLIAQMYEMTGSYEKASDYYGQASKKTTNILMDIFARLNDAKMLRTNPNPKDLDNSISKLLQMTKKDKFESYKDILLYSAGQLTLQKPDTAAALGLFKKSIANNVSASDYREKAFLKMADISFLIGDYENAKNYYDSLGTKIGNLETDSLTIVERTEILARLVPKINAINEEDSLQMIAAMSIPEREKFVKAIAKKIRIANGLKEESYTGSDPITFANSTTAVDLFNTSANSNGQWYFYNAALKGKGFNEFKQRWGKRSNIDNWRRSSATANNIPKNNNTPESPSAPDAMGNNDPNAPLDANAKVIAPQKKELDFSYEGLMGNVPLTKEMLDSSNTIIGSNLIEAAVIFQNELQDYNRAIIYYNRYVDNNNAGDKLADAYGGLAFCYEKLGDKNKAAFFKNILKTKYADSKANKIISNPESLKTNVANPKATANYENIYNLFAAGKYEEAMNAKQAADSLYGKNYWSPQLLYIEAVGQAKAQKDSMAVSTLQALITFYPTTPIKNKAEVLKNILEKKLAEEKIKADAIAAVEAAKKAALEVVKAAQAKLDSIKNIKLVVKPKVDSATIKLNLLFPVNKLGPHSAVLILNKIEKANLGLLQTGFENFNKQDKATSVVFLNTLPIDANNTLLLFDEFRNADSAIAYINIIKKVLPTNFKWLKPKDYSFVIISQSNLNLLITNKRLDDYRKVFKNNYNVKF